MDKKKAIQVLLKVANIYVGMLREDRQVEEEEQYLEILQAMEVLKKWIAR
jgi:hypothetical protein